jgi:pyruvate dehydrogenase E1 component
VADKTDAELGMLHRGGHDPAKIYNAYKRAVEHKGQPTVVLAMTVKGYGLGSAQARNATHSEKKLADDGLAAFVKRFDIPIPEQAAKDGGFYRPQADAPELQYMQARRKELGGYLPQRAVPELKDRAPEFKAPELDFFKNWTAGSNGRSISTTMGFVNLLNALMKDKAIGKWIVPIVPDEGRTFGLESSIKQVGIYAPEGQKYVPHDADMLLSYRENKDGQILDVLLDVRLPTHRRYGLGIRGLAGQGLPDGRHGRPHDHARRRPATPGWSFGGALQHRPDVRHLRFRLRL